MAQERDELDPLVMQANLENLGSSYPSHGIVLGKSPDGKSAVQVYWVTGRRNETSQNLILVEGDTDVIIRAEAHSPNKAVNIDPALITYNAMRTVTRLVRTHHVVSNGQQADALFERLWDRRAPDATVHDAFRRVLSEWRPEPDAPIYTPQITGMLSHQRALSDTFDYSITRRSLLAGAAEHTFGSIALDDLPSGTGLCLHTCDENDNSPQALNDIPCAIPVAGTAEETAGTFWEVLGSEIRVAVKTIDRLSGKTSGYRIINQNQRAA